MQLIEKKVTAERAMGVESTVLLRNELLAVAPYLGPHVIGGSFLKARALQIRCSSHRAHTKAAQRHGARFLSDTPVRAIAREKDGGFVIETGRGAFRARQVVSASGAWTAELGRMVGFENYRSRRRRPGHRHEARPRSCWTISFSTLARA